MKRWIHIIVALALVLPASAADWRLALPGWQYEFPRDHHLHADFKTEWWYFTGRLADDKGGVFGYQLTFFRQGLRPPENRGGTTSRFIVDDLKFAHFAISDIRAQQFHFQQKLSRGAFAEAGFSAADRLAWIDDWSLKLDPDGTFTLHANDGSTALQLHLESTKPFAIHGENGASQKAEGAGHASHYFSATRLVTSGTLTLAGQALSVRGESWLDREWASNQLTANQVGWNWFSLQFDDGTELMLYQMCTKDGGLDPNSSGTFIARDGTTQHLRREDYQITPTKFWTSKASQARYPIAWQLTVPKLNLQCGISTPLESQELVLNPIAYWEGLIDLQGNHDGMKVHGHGYMELTGYAGALVGLAEEK
ncbi:MAG: lipocalin-like domain-containing protein [Chthoniobacter sp.]|nr:lipocalin-like domain-containing protein [Chthoniobacter sp.]